MQDIKFERKKLRAYEVAKIYGVSEGTIWNYAKRGFLKVVKPSERVTLFDAMECEAFFNGKSEQCQN